MARPRLLCIMGPTASGKTAVAVELAEALDAELVSVDSALVYRGLDIGSAKPDYPHHLIDIRDPADPYSAAQFVEDATRVVAGIVDRGRLPILVGGTMLYFRAFLYGLDAMPAADPALRARIEADARREGWPAIHERLQQVDPAAAARIHPNHSQRLTRALEVYLLSGRPLSDWHSGTPGNAAAMDHYRVLCVALAPQDRAVLHQRIEARFRQMMAAGFLDEVRSLFARGDLDPSLPALRSVGYRQLWSHLAGELSLEQAVDQGVIATRQLAKRQLTWLRKWPDLKWIFTDAAGAPIVGDGGPNLRASDLILNYLA